MAIDTELRNAGCKVESNVELNQFTNTKTGGIIKFMIYPFTVKQLQDAIMILRNSALKYIVLGEMTNIAVASGDLDFSVINMTKMTAEPEWDSSTHELIVSAGYKMKELAKWAYQHAISDLQWMEGIPGTVGAGAFMNAGFLSGKDFSNFLISVDVIDIDLKIRTITNDELQYRYRKSTLQGSGAIVISAKFLLRPGKKWKIGIRMMQYHRRRAKRQPLELPSAGTVFVPPTPYHLGAIIPRLGLLNKTVGGARVSEKSPGFIVGENMTGEDYFGLVKFLQSEVKKKKGLLIDPEVRLIGFSDQLSWPVSCSWQPKNRKV